MFGSGVSTLCVVLISLAIWIGDAGVSADQTDKKESNLQPVVTICDPPSSSETDTRCTGSGRCTSFLPTGDVTKDLHADTCYWGSRFTPVLRDAFAIEFLCPDNTTEQHNGGMCATLVVADTDDQCLAWANMTQPDRQQKWRSEAATVLTMNMVCNKCQFRAPTGYWKLDCSSGIATLRQCGTTSDCSLCQGSKYDMSSSPGYACAPMDLVTGPGDINRHATLMAPPQPCEWSGVKLFMPKTGRPPVSNDWVGRCFSDFDRPDSLTGIEYMIDGGCLPLPGYSSLAAGPTVSVQCKQYDVRPVWMSGYTVGRSEDPPESKATLAFMIILLLVAIAVVVGVAFFIRRSRARAAQLEAERTSYFHAVDTQAPTAMTSQPPVRRPPPSTGLHEDDDDDQEGHRMMPNRRR